MEKDLGSLLRQMRKSAGLSQMKLADKLGISYQQVQKYEKGASKLNVHRLLQIADIFSVPVTAFIEHSGAAKTTKSNAAYSNLSNDEIKLVTYYRRLKRKNLKKSFTSILKDIVKLSEYNGA